MAELLLHSPLFEHLANCLEFDEVGRVVDWATVKLSGHRLLGLAAIATKGSLHAVPVLDREVRVDLGDVLDEEPCVELLLAHHVEHANLRHQRAVDLRADLVHSLAVRIGRVGIRV